MKLLSTNTCQIPRDLASVTGIARETENAPEMAGLSAASVERIWNSVEGLYRTGVYPALTFCLRRRGQILLNRSLGHVRGNGPDDGPNVTKVLATPDSPVCLFSASKVVTAMLIHLLDERGEVDLLDPISHYIPEYAVNGKRNATIYHLLAHRGGIPRFDGEFNVELGFDHDAVIAKLCAAKPVHPSGHRMAYHAVTAGYILGEVIQRVTGKDTREFLRETVQEPMGMRYFNYGLPPEAHELAAVQYATGFKTVFPFDAYLKHAVGGDMDLVMRLTNDPRFLETIIPAGNLYATAEEASRFFQMLLDGGSYNGRQIFHPDTIRRSIIPISRPELDRTLLMPMRYSMGFMLGSSPIGLWGPFTGQAFGHLGFTNIMCWADPARDTSVALLTSGKPIAGPHLPALVNFLTVINKECRHP